MRLRRRRIIDITTDRQRIAVAIGPWLLGSPVLEKATLSSTNPEVLYKTDSYSWTLASARLGELPFFILAALVVWWWARRLHGEFAALMAILLFTTLPPVAHMVQHEGNQSVGA